MQEVGYCPGIENYSTGRRAAARSGSPPDTSYSFFPDDFLLLVDESHATVPQIRGMYFGDHNRKVTLVEHGFRLPSALDNRPLRFEEWEGRIQQAIFVSATPGPYELGKTGGETVQQVIRPTGLLDPEIEIAAARNQVPHLLEEIRKRSAAGEPRLGHALFTKRLASKTLGAAYFSKQDVLCKWLHSELDALEPRPELLLRSAESASFDVLVGVNFLARSGLDPFEVSLVAILDADKEGLCGAKRRSCRRSAARARNVERQGAALRRQGHRLDAAGHRRDAPPPRIAASLQHRTRHHAGNDPWAAIHAGIDSEAAAHAAANAAVGRGRRSPVHHRGILGRIEVEMLAAAEGVELGTSGAAIRDRIEQMRDQFASRWARRRRTATVAVFAAGRSR